jgi:hypothetical protein
VALRRGLPRAAGVRTAADRAIRARTRRDRRCPDADRHTGGGDPGARPHRADTARRRRLRLAGTAARVDGLAGRAVGLGRRAAVAADAGRRAVAATPLPRSAWRSGGVAGPRRCPRPSPRRAAPGRAAADRRWRRPRDRGLVASGDPAARSRRDAHARGPAGSAAGARTGPRSPSRLRGQPAATVDRNAAVLPPRGVVAVAPHPPRTRARRRRSRRHRAG